MLVGYARVSIIKKYLDLHRDALPHAGCGRIFTDTAGGAKAERPGLAAALNFAREGDALAVWTLDRLGRFLKDLLEIVTALEQRGIGFKSLQESTDTTTPGGKLIFHVFAALAEFERGVIRECTEPPDTIGFIYMLAGDTGTTNHHPHQRNTRETSA